MLKTVLKSVTIIMAVLLALLLLTAAILWFKPQADFPHDTARDLPWKLPDYQAANTQVKILSDGRIQIDIEHLPLNNIQPEMLAYFYQVLPISTVTLNGTHYPLYHLFHPNEHGIIEVKEAATDGTPGMAAGALVARQEWFGEFNSRGAGRVDSIDEHGMTVLPEMLGLHFGKIEHIFEQTPNGTRYRVHSIIGSQLPIIGGVINYYIREKMFKAEMLKQWLRHQVQEVSSLSFFLPQLFAQKEVVENYHFTLNVTK